MTPMESFEAAVEELKKTLTAEEAEAIDNQFLDLQEGGEGTDEEKEQAKKGFYADVLSQAEWTVEDVKAFFIADTTDEDEAAAADPGADSGDADDADDQGDDDETTDDEADDSQAAATDPQAPADPVTPPPAVPLRRRRSIGGTPTVSATAPVHTEAAATTESVHHEPEPPRQLSEAEMFEALRLAAEADAKLRADRVKMVPLTAAFKAHQKRMLDFAVAEKDKRDKAAAKALEDAEKKDEKAKQDAKKEKQRQHQADLKRFGLTELEYAGDFSESPVKSPLNDLLKLVTAPFRGISDWARRTFHDHDDDSRG